MTDDELLDEIEELVETKIVYHYQMSLVGNDPLKEHHLKQADVYNSALMLLQKMRYDKRKIL